MSGFGSEPTLFYAKSVRGNLVPADILPENGNEGVELKKTEIEEQTRELIIPILEEHHLELWDVEYVKEGQDMYLRAYIDKADGVSIDDCVTVSRALEKELDREDFIAEAYILEVSSPGLTRPLKKTVDFTRSIGKKVELKLYQPVDGPVFGKEFEAVLLEADDDIIRVDTENGELQIERSNLAKARLCYVEKSEDEVLGSDDQYEE